MKVTFDDLVAPSTPTVIDFYANWCAPCRLVGPILEDLKSDLGENIRIFKIDVDENPAIAQHYQVRSIPTIMVFKDGKLRWRESGVQTKAKIKSVVAGL